MQTVGGTGLSASESGGSAGECVKNPVAARTVIAGREGRVSGDAEPFGLWS